MFKLSAQGNLSVTASSILALLFFGGLAFLAVIDPGLGCSDLECEQQAIKDSRNITFYLWSCLPLAWFGFTLYAARLKLPNPSSEQNV